LEDNKTVKSPIIIGGTILLGIIAISIQAKKGEIKVGPLAEYGAYLNDLFPPNSFEYPIAKQTLREPTKKIQLFATHQHPATYSLYFFHTETEGKSESPKPGQVKVTLKATDDTNTHIYTFPDTAGFPAYFNGRMAQKIITYRVPKHTKNHKNTFVEVEFLENPNQIFDKTKTIVCAIYAESQP
jgi:hypothetical protein